MWILCADYGCEGLYEPFYSFKTKEEAKAAEKMVQDFFGSGTKIIEPTPYEEIKCIIEL